MELRKRQAKKERSGKKGVWMEMLMLQPSLEPELCIGKTAPYRLCSVWSPLRSVLLVPFSKGWESTIKLTSLSSVPLSVNLPKRNVLGFLFSRFSKL